MTELKSAGIRKIEERIKDADPDSLRALVLNKAKDFGRVANLVRSLLPGSGKTPKESVP